MIFKKILDCFNKKNKEIYHNSAKFNITISELEAAVEFAKNNSLHKHGTITMEVKQENGIGSTFLVSSTYDGNQLDITNIDTW